MLLERIRASSISKDTMLTFAIAPSDRSRGLRRFFDAWVDASPENTTTAVPNDEQAGQGTETRWLSWKAGLNRRLRLGFGIQ